MAMIVGYLATPEGQEALRAATQEARLRSTPLVVVVSERTSRMSAEQVRQRESDVAAVRAELDASGLEYEVRVMGDSSDVADDLVAVAEETGAMLIVIGLRRRSPVGKL